MADTEICGENECMSLGPHGQIIYAPAGTPFTPGKVIGKFTDDPTPARDFTIDWDREQATCPEGRISTGWSPAVDRGHNEVIKIKFSAKDCGKCAARVR